MNHPTAESRSGHSMVRGDYSMDRSMVRDTMVRARLALLRELESSLQSSQKALLARELAAIERGTDEQRRLLEALNDLVRATGCIHSQQAVGIELAQVLHSPELAALRAAETRILHLGRVQLALLARARRFLNALSHFAHGPSASYIPPASASAAGPPSIHGVQTQSCRV
jgi:hypothetical protein